MTTSGPGIYSGTMNSEINVADFLWNHARNEDNNLFAIVDSARNDEVFRHFLTCNVAYRSLFQGTMDEQSWGFSGFLVECQRGSDIYRWMTTEAWGKSCCIFFTSKSGFDEVFKHLQKFNRVGLEDDGDIVYFRFYDPRVLRVFLPTCDPKEIKTFFGEISCFMVENEDPAMVTLFKRIQGTWSHTMEASYHKVSLTNDDDRENMSI